jgi:hypothetical protein
MRTVSFGHAMKPTEVSLQAEPSPSRTRADTCHAPCHRSRDPGHERVVTGTNPRCSALSPTIVAGSARTWPARRDVTCSGRGCARVRRDRLGQRRQPETICAASLHSLFLDSAWNSVGGISRCFSRSRFRTRRSAHSLFLRPRPVGSDRPGSAITHRLSRPPTAPEVRRPAPAQTATEHVVRTGTASTTRRTTASYVGHSTNRAITERCLRPASTADPIALPGVCEIFVTDTDARSLRQPDASNGRSPARSATTPARHLRLSASAPPCGDFGSRSGVGLPNVLKEGSRAVPAADGALHVRKSLTQRDDSICPNG